MRTLLLLIAVLIFINNAISQKQRFDSLSAKLKIEKIDSNKVNLLWQMAEAGNLYNPDSSVSLAQQALYLAQKIQYSSGESNSLSMLATALTNIGNYPSALSFYLKKLELEEKRKQQRDFASTLINIGILYAFQEQYKDALQYYRQADSIIVQNNVEDLKYFILLNLGDAFEKLNQVDSSFNYYRQSLEVADNMNNTLFQGQSMVGLGNIYLKKNDFDASLQNYRQALSYLNTSNDFDNICEANLGLARLYEKRNMDDSTRYYAEQSFTLAKEGGFETRQLNAAAFLTDYFKTGNITDSAFKYLETMQLLNNSVYSKEKIREAQIISTNEQIRQNEIAENKRKAEEERHQQLQMLIIGIGIVLLFLLTLLLNRVRVNHRLIRFFGIISLLMFFEYLLLLLHPWVETITNHTPALEILIFVLLASIIIPTHHKLEHWLLEKLSNAKLISKKQLVAIEEFTGDEEST
jgi:tetratricopeptide (TPR) repeat protein